MQMPDGARRDYIMICEADAALCLCWRQRFVNGRMFLKVDATGSGVKVAVVRNATRVAGGAQHRLEFLG